MKNETPIVVVIGDEPIVCAATSRLLRSAGYQVRTFETTRQLFAQGRPPGPCCVVLDLQLPEENGLQFQQRLVKSGIRVPIIFVSGRADIHTSVSAMKAGANDFLLKPYDDSQLLAAIAAALDKDARTLSTDRHLSDVRQHCGTLTAREREVFAAVAAGLLNKQVALELGIAEKTIKVHRSRVMEKMHAVALADLVRMADLLQLRWESSDNTAVYADFADSHLGGQFS